MHVEAVVSPDQRRRARAYVAGRSGGATGLSEAKQGWLERDDGRPGIGLMSVADGRPVGYAGLVPARGGGTWAVEVLAGEAAAVLQLVAAAETAARGAGAERLRWWTYDADTETLPPRVGFETERHLLRMGRPLPGPDPRFPPGFEVASFRPGVDEEAWLGTNNAAFAGHQENSDLERADLERRLASDWFDPAGLRMLWYGETLAGFCWTKRHSPHQGEIYIIGTDPSFQGRGLGRDLVLEGMRHLAGGGCRQVFLYTEGDNDRAIRLYEALGFGVEVVHRSFLKALG